MSLDFGTFLTYTMLVTYVLAFLASMIYLPKYHDSPLRFMPFILLYTFLNETLGYIIYTHPEYKLISQEGYAHYNIIIYNIYDIIFFPYFYYVFWSCINYEKHKEIILFGGTLFFFVSIINLYLQNPMLASQTITYVYGGLFLIYCILLYFSKLRFSPKKTTQQDLLFWTGSGLFIFFIGYLPIEIKRYFDALSDTTEPTYIRHIQLILIIVMYVLIIVGFIKMKNKKPFSKMS